MLIEVREDAEGRTGRQCLALSAKVCPKACGATSVVRS
jgi:hypothetical protein